MSCMLILCGVCCACPAVRGCILCYGGGKNRKERRDLYNDVNHTLIIVLFVV